MDGQKKVLSLIMFHHAENCEMTEYVNDRLVIPSTLRDVLSQIHEGHQGVEKCKERATFIFIL